MSSTTNPAGPHDEGATGEFIAAKPSRALDLATAAVLCLFFGTVLVASRMLHESVHTEGLTLRSWPTMTGAAGLLCSILLLVGAMTGRPSGRGELEAANPAGRRRVALSMFAVAAGILIWWAGLNFIVVTPVLVAAVMWIGGVRRVKPLVLLPVTVTVLIFVLFVLVLKVPL